MIVSILYSIEEDKFIGFIENDIVIYERTGIFKMLSVKHNQKDIEIELTPEQLEFINKRTEELKDLNTPVTKTLNTSNGSVKITMLKKIFLESEKGFVSVELISIDTKLIPLPREDLVLSGFSIKKNTHGLFCILGYFEGTRLNVKGKMISVEYAIS